MSSYAETARERNKARALFLELSALGLQLHVNEDLHDATGYRVTVTGVRSLGQTHADRVRRLVEANKPGLLRVLMVLIGRWDPDVLAIQREGADLSALEAAWLPMLSVASWGNTGAS
jgi:hypothetical protein